MGSPSSFHCLTLAPTELITHLQPFILTRFLGYLEAKAALDKDLWVLTASPSLLLLHFASPPPGPISHSYLPGKHCWSQQVRPLDTRQHVVSLHQPQVGQGAAEMRRLDNPVYTGIINV